MPKRSKVELLPAEVREQLEQILLKSGFSGYRELEDWCRQQGIDISKSSLQRFGDRFAERVAGMQLATQQARAIVQSAPDDDNAVNDALIRLVQEQMLKLLIDLTPEERKKLKLHDIAKGIAHLGRASVQQKKYANEVRKRTEEAAEAASKIAKRGGLSAGAVDMIRKEILGITT